MSGKFDEAFASIHNDFKKTGFGADMKFVDAFFSYLRRKTRLLSHPKAVQQVQQLAMKHVRMGKKKKGTKPASESKVASGESGTTDPTPAFKESGTTEAKPETQPPSAKGSESQSHTENIKDIPSVTVEEVDETKDKELERDQDPMTRNGGSSEHYKWSQTLQDVTVSIPVDKSVRGKHCIVSISQENISVSLPGKGKCIDAPPADELEIDECVWTLENEDSGRYLVLYLRKEKGNDWWSTPFKGHKEVDVAKIKPQDSQLSDLDPSTRSTVEKMMYENEQKRKLENEARARVSAAQNNNSGNANGGGNSGGAMDAQQRQALLKRFMAAHPEMDFSNAKINL